MFGTVGIQSVDGRVFSTIRGLHEYIEGCTVQWEDTISTLQGFQYSMREIISTWEMFSTVRGILSAHERVINTVGISSVPTVLCGVKVQSVHWTCKSRERVRPLRHLDPVVHIVLKKRIKRLMKSF